MMEVEAGQSTETAAADLNAILADEQPSPAPVQEQAEEAPQVEAEATPEAKPEAKPEAQQPFWYRKEIEKERKKRQDLERQLQQVQQQRPETNLPDPRQDPIAYVEHVRLVDNLARSEDRFVDKHGEQEFESVRDWLTTRPDIEAWAQQQRHPWGAAYQQYQREKLSAEIGDDPNAWREKERERLRAEILAEMPSAPMAQPRPNIPAPASGQRSAAPRDGQGRFAGPPPLSDILGKR